MSAGAATKATLDGLFKDVYADKLEDLRPDFSHLMNSIPFSTANKTGRDFVKAVMLSNEQGFTYGAGLQTLSGIITADVDDAKVRGTSLTLQAGFSYDAAANMASSKGAFIDSTKFKFMNMMKSASHRIETQMLYGNVGLGTVASVVDASDTLTFSDASWSVGIWAGQEGAAIDIYDSTGVTLRATTSVVAVNATTKTLTLTTGTDLSTTVAGDIVWYKNSKGNEMVGLRSIVSNAGSLYGIAGATYSLWQGNTLAVGGNLTLRKIYDGLATPVGKGLMEEIEVLVSPFTFATLANDQASLRRYNATTGKAENGFEAIKFYGPNGVINIVTHPLVKAGEAIAYPVKQCERIGATDLTFNTPGKGDEMFQQMATQTGFECRLYSEQAIFMPCPAKGLLYTGIVNT